MLDFDKIKNAVKELQVDDLRLDDEANLEAVVSSKEADKLMGRLEGFFGPPVFPAKNSLSAQASGHIRAFGGIWPGQTLYYSNHDNGAIFAMLRPWSSNQCITVKLVKIKIPSRPPKNY